MTILGELLDPEKEVNGKSFTLYRARYKEVSASSGWAVGCAGKLKYFKTRDRAVAFIVETLDEEIEETIKELQNTKQEARSR